MSIPSYMRAWYRRRDRSHPCTSLSALKTNGSNRGLKHAPGTDYTMDELATFSQRYDEDTLYVLQGVKVSADYKTRQHLMIGVKMVYQVQSEEENWSRTAYALKNIYAKVAVKSFYSIVERMTQNLYQISLGWNMYVVLTMIDFKKFQGFYTKQQWKQLLFNLNAIHKYYIENKKDIPTTMDRKFEF